MEFLFLLLLILMNGLFAMSEIAVVSSRKARLQQLTDEGKAGAGAALELAAEPGHFLSAIQVGITLIGILSGAFGEATIAAGLSDISTWKTPPAKASARSGNASIPSCRCAGGVSPTSWV